MTIYPALKRVLIGLAELLAAIFLKAMVASLIFLLGAPTVVGAIAVMAFTMFIVDLGSVPFKNSIFFQHKKDDWLFDADNFVLAQSRVDINTWRYNPRDDSVRANNDNEREDAQRFIDHFEAIGYKFSDHEKNQLINPMYLIGRSSLYEEGRAIVNRTESYFMAKTLFAMGAGALGGIALGTLLLGVPGLPYLLASVMVYLSCKAVYNISRGIFAACWNHRLARKMESEKAEDLTQPITDPLPPGPSARLQQTFPSNRNEVSSGPASVAANPQDELTPSELGVVVEGPENALPGDTYRARM